MSSPNVTAMDLRMNYILIAFCGGAWYNIEAARQHAAVKRSLSMQETAFFKILMNQKGE